MHEFLTFVVLEDCSVQCVVLAFVHVDNEVDCAMSDIIDTLVKQSTIDHAVNGF